MGITCGAFSRKTTLFSAHLGFAFRQLSTLKKMHQKMVVFGQCLASIPASMSSSEAIQPPQTDPAYMQQVTVLWSLCVVWDQRIPHGSDGNSSFRPRMAQFVKMFPRKLLTPKLQQQRAALLSRTLWRAQVKDGWDLLFLNEPSRSEKGPTAKSVKPKTGRWESSRSEEEATAQSVKPKTRRWGKQ